jgi:hypothetical protein
MEDVFAGQLRDNFVFFEGLLAYRAALRCLRHFQGFEFLLMGCTQTAISLMLIPSKLFQVKAHWHAGSWHHYVGWCLSKSDHWCLGDLEKLLVRAVLVFCGKS